MGYSGPRIEITDAVTSAAGWTTPNEMTSGNIASVQAEIRADNTVPGDAILSSLFEVSSKPDSDARGVVGAVTSNVPDPNQLVKNGRFSEAPFGSNVPTYWQPSVEQNTMAGFSLQNEGAYSAPTSLLVSVKSGTARIEQDLSSLPQTPLTFSGYAKGVRPGQSVIGVVQMFDSSGTITQTPVVVIGVSTEWKRFARPLYIPVGTTRARLIFEVHGESDVSLDDISILPTKPGDFPDQGQNQG